MIVSLVAIGLQAAAPAQPADSAYIKCAFTKGGELATATTDTPERVAEKVLAECTADTKAGPVTDFTRLRMRTAAVAMVNRKRGTDGLPADAPIRLPEITERREASIDIPDEIAPAVIPYMLCQVASAGVPMYTDGRKALIPPPPGITKGSDCSAARAKAATDADRMLKQAGRKGKTERAAYVEKVLQSMDEFQAASQARRATASDPTD